MTASYQAGKQAAFGKHLGEAMCCILLANYVVLLKPLRCCHLFVKYLK